MNALRPSACAGLLEAGPLALESGPRAAGAGARDIILQHRRLLEALEDIEDLAAGGDGSAEWRSTCLELIEEFLWRLQEHFIAEGATSVGESAEQHGPWLASQLERLDSEHPVLLRSFCSVREMVLNPGRGPRAIQEALARAAAAFREHEAQENAVFAMLP